MTETTHTGLQKDTWRHGDHVMVMVELYKLISGKYENNTSKCVKLYSEHNALSDRS